VGKDPKTGVEVKSGQRHYTIANSMKKDMYNEFVRSIDEAIDKSTSNTYQGTTFNKKFLD
jgi:hypothetical protein